MANISKTQAWFLAARPKTLFAGATPVIVGSALAMHYHTFNWVPALLCLVFALLAQIASNLANDYYDFINKTDNEDRIGPARAVASGWITPKEMQIGMSLVILLACCVGLGLIYYGGWQMIWVGIAVVIGLLAYSTGPFPLSYHGLGDVFVLIFFGLVPVVFTFYVQSGFIGPWAIICGIAVGLVSTNILVVNNYRDYENDKKANKRTTIVLFGKRFGEYLYCLNGYIAVAIVFGYFYMEYAYVAACFPVFYLITHDRLYRMLKSTTEGIKFNQLLGLTSLNLLFFGVLLSVALYYSQVLV